MITPNGVPNTVHLLTLIPLGVLKHMTLSIVSVVHSMVTPCVPLTPLLLQYLYEIYMRDASIYKHSDN